VARAAGVNRSRLRRRGGRNARRIAEQRALGAKIVALTIGAEGALLGDASGVSAIAPPQARAVDASGAGDCFDGAFLARLLAGDSPKAAADYAVTAAALSVEGYGAVAPIPTADAVAARLASR
ncbi:MAG: PfkB family carbohydrate kinase, partial [Pseudomonadota bacterium]